MWGIAGATGLIGRNFYKFLSEEKQKVRGTYCRSLDRHDDFVYFNLEDAHFDVFEPCKYVAICSAKSKLEYCRVHEAEARRINVEKTKDFITYLIDKKIKPIFLSSGQVFDGRKGNYEEGDKSYPLNKYGEMKLEIEKFITKNFAKNCLIIRLSKTYSRDIGDGGIFTEIYQNLKHEHEVRMIDDLICNFTDVNFVCKGIYKLKDTQGVFHLTQNNPMTYYEFALNIAREFNFKKDLIKPIKFCELNFLEKKPKNSSLSSSKFCEFSRGH